MAGKRTRKTQDHEHAAHRKRGKPRTDEGEVTDAPARIDDVGPVADPVLVAGNDPQQLDAPPLDRRQGMAEIARRRAAHFANFQVDDDGDGDDNVHVGGNTARTLGPWSSARELTEKRAQVTAAREEKLLERRAALDAEGVRWTPSRDPALGPRVLHELPKLFDLCVDLVVEYIEDVETLWGLPDSIKVRIADAVCRQSKLTKDTSRLFIEGAPCDVVLQNCTKLDADDMTELLCEVATPKIESLMLSNCGRGLTNKAVQKVMGKVKELSALTKLQLQGAYQLSDEGLLSIVSKCPRLEDLRVCKSPNICGALVEQLPSLASQLRVMDLSECRAVSSSCLAASFPGLPQLHTLSLNGLLEVNDQLLVEGALALTNLRSLSIAMCSGVSDLGIQGLAVARPQLQVLHLDDVSKITDESLHALAQHCKDLQVLSLKNCQRLSDEGCSAVASGCNLRDIGMDSVIKVGAATMSALASFCRERLEVVDLSWCRGVTDDMLGHLVDSCPHLRLITLWGCSQISDVFLNGHSNDRLAIIGRGEVLQDVRIS